MSKVFTTYDSNPFDGENFYRLKLVFLDGTETYSEVRKVNFDGINKINIFPNPANDELTFDLQPYLSRSVTVYVYDQLGRMIEAFQIGEVSEQFF